MPRKISDSIRRNLDKLRGVFHESPEPSPSKPVKKSGKTKPSGTTEPKPPESSEAAPTAPAPKKGSSGQPWYRHRQRW